MARSYKNITGSTAVELLPMFSEYGSNIKSIMLSNIHASDSVNVDLYLRREDPDTGVRTDNEFFDVKSNDTDDAVALETMNDYTETETVYTYYIIKGLNIPVNATLILEEKELSFDNTSYSIHIKLSASDSAVDVTINGEETASFYNSKTQQDPVKLYNKIRT